MDEYLTMNQAMNQTSKSATTIKRLIKLHKIPTKKAGKAQNSPTLISRNHLLNALAQNQSTVRPATRPKTQPVTRPQPSQKEELVDILKEQIRRLEEEKRELKTELAQARQENRALQEELKAYLRQQQGKQSKGIAGYLIDRVWRGQK